MLSERDSTTAFRLLLRSDATLSSDARLLVARAIVGSFLGQGCARGVLLHTSHSGLEFGRYFKTLERRGVRTVFMLHDLIPLSHAEYCRPGVLERHHARMRIALHHAAGVVANSRVTLESLIDAADHNAWSIPKAVVAPLASGIVKKMVTHIPRLVARPYFVMLGTIEPRKNHWFMLHVWRRLVETLGDRAPMLVVIGRRGWECENVVDMLERCSALRGALIEEADCSDERLYNYLHHSQALLFPSFVEGYGMPLAEALAMRVPVIASDLPVFHEIAGDIPDYLDPLDGPGWISRILEYSQPASSLRADQLIRIEGFREPTWQEHFEVVDKFIEELA